MIALRLQQVALMIAFLGASSNAIRWARVGVNSHQCHDCGIVSGGGQGFGSSVQLLAALAALAALVMVAIFNTRSNHGFTAASLVAVGGIALLIIGNHLSPLYIVAGLHSFDTADRVGEVETYSWLATACFVLVACVSVALLVGTLRPQTKQVSAEPLAH